MDFERRKITHFFMRPPEPDAWVPLGFITIDDKGIIYPGYDEKSYLDDDWKPLKDIGQFGDSLEKLLNPLEVVIDSQNYDALWLTPDFEVYFSTKEDPVRDPDNKFLQRANH